MKRGNKEEFTFHLWHNTVGFQLSQNIFCFGWCRQCPEPHHFNFNYLPFGRFSLNRPCHHLNNLSIGLYLHLKFFFFLIHVFTCKSFPCIDIQKAQDCWALLSWIWCQQLQQLELSLNWLGGAEELCQHRQYLDNAREEEQYDGGDISCARKLTLSGG